ncbi:hypothetical protein PIB30_067618 [Stylosanthes scabra]|uniref:Uncharacterized protein n=1 Tax=Stylosanthes scabra TaxID=79078 RepID=A0ABU6SNP3_9FABA|nr:hypothetical protein [Stylosanthes scabra]
MRYWLWKRKQEPAAEEPPEDGSSVIKSSENNSVQLLEVNFGRSTVNSDLATIEFGHREMISRGLMSITIGKNVIYCG